MSNEKINFNKVILKAELISDNIVRLFYNDKLVSKVESLDIIKNLSKLSFINGLQKLGKGWFRQFFIFSGYLSLVFGLFSLIKSFLSLFNYIGNLYVIFSIIISIVFGLLTFVMGFGMIKFKKRFPFIALIQGGTYLLFIILSYFLYFNPYYMIGISFGGFFINIILFLIIFIIYYVLIIKNKKVFAGDFINDKKNKKQNK